MKNGYFFKEYKEELINLYKLKYNKLNLDNNDIQKIDTLLDKYISEYYQPKRIQISNSVQQNIDEDPMDCDVLKTYDKCRRLNYVFSLSHGVFKNGDSLFLNKWDNLKKQRDYSKKLMKQALEDNNKAEYYMYKGHQDVKKRNANGMYGACGERNFILYNVDVISNLTGTCFYILTTTINQIEKILGSRIIIRDQNEFIEYITYLINKDISSIQTMQDDLNILNKIKETLTIEDIDYIINRYKSYCLFELDNNILTTFKNLLNTLYQEDILRLALFKYNCDLNTFMQDTNFIYKIIDKNFDNYISDGKAYSEHSFKESNKDLKIILESLVYEDNFQHDVQYLCDNFDRSTVMLSDTDSTFCVSNKLFNNIMQSLKQLCKDKNIQLNSELDYKVHSFKTIMYIGESMSDFFLKTIAGPKYQNSFDNRWKLKSEFLYNKIVLFTVKKTYFGSILSQEGIRINPIKLDNKNTELVRSVYNTITKGFVKDLYEVLVMKEKDATIKDIFDLIKKHHHIFNQVKNNSYELSKLGSKADYKLDIVYKNDPYSVYQYKAASLFNALYPETKIAQGNKTRLFPVKNAKSIVIEHYIDKDKFISHCNITDEEVLNKLSKSKIFKDSKLNIYSVLDYFAKYKLDEYVLNKNNYKKYITLSNKKRNEIIINWYIENYGLNEDLKNRFTLLFNNKANKKLINVLLNDIQINYIAIDYYKTMPSSLIDLIDTDKLKLDSINERTTRILETLKYKIYNKSTKSKIQTTNILKI